MIEFSNQDALALSQGTDYHVAQFDRLTEEADSYFNGYLQSIIYTFLSPAISLEKYGISFQAVAASSNMFHIRHDKTIEINFETLIHYSVAQLTALLFGTFYRTNYPPIMSNQDIHDFYSKIQKSYEQQIGFNIKDVDFLLKIIIAPQD